MREGRSMRFWPLLILLTLATASAQRWPTEVGLELATAKLESTKPLSRAVENWDGSNEYYQLTLEGGRKAVFRSEDEPWGSLAEVAAYRVDQHLGTDLVPPTAERTLTAQEWGPDWPWPKLKERRGSVQLFVEGARPVREGDELPQPDLANSEILCFVLGRYDNHSGNLLLSSDGRLVLVDFEGALDHQKVRYGDFAYIKRGGWAESPLNIPASKPFPFDNPRKLVDPTLEEIQTTFNPWWGQYWAVGMKGLHGLLRGIPERTIPYAIWGNRLWVQVRVRSRHPAHTDLYPAPTMKALNEMTLHQLTKLLGGEPFSPAHARGMMERVGQLLNASRHDDSV